MEQKTLKKLWKETLDYGYNVRRNNLDGLKSWQDVKSKYSNMYIDGYEKGISMKEYFSFIAKDKYIPGSDKEEHTKSKFKIGSDELDNTVESHHFYIQHFRIPELEKYKLSVLKLLQIAYNAGQFKAESEKNNLSYKKDFVEFYKTNKLDKIDTFIDKKYIDMIPKMKVTGGSKNDIYYAKYMKYKGKYLELKNIY